MKEIVRKGSHERFHEDSKGRRWDFVQKERLHRRSAAQFPPDHPWNQGKLFWVCSECGGIEPVRYESFIHDEVTVPDPTAQLDLHDCGEEHVRQVMET
jgi:hypothetical protein